MGSVEKFLMDEDDDGDTLLKEPKAVDLNRIKQMEQNKEKNKKKHK